MQAKKPFTDIENTPSKPHKESLNCLVNDIKQGQYLSRHQDRNYGYYTGGYDNHGLYEKVYNIPSQYIALYPSLLTLYTENGSSLLRTACKYGSKNAVDDFLQYEEVLLQETADYHNALSFTYCHGLPTTSDHQVIFLLVLKEILSLGDRDQNRIITNATIHILNLYSHGENTIYDANCVKFVSCLLTEFSDNHANIKFPHIENLEKNNKSNIPMLAVIGLKDNVKIMSYLIGQGFDFAKKDSLGNSVIMYAAMHNTPAVLEFLLNAFAEKKIPTKDANTAGDTPFMLAVQHGNISTAEILLSGDQAMLLHVNNSSQSAFDLAYNAGKHEVAAWVWEKQLAELLQTGMSTKENQRVMASIERGFKCLIQAPTPPEIIAQAKKSLINLIHQEMSKFFESQIAATSDKLSSQESIQLTNLRYLFEKSKALIPPHELYVGLIDKYPNIFKTDLITESKFIQIFASIKEIDPSIHCQLLEANTAFLMGFHQYAFQISKNLHSSELSQQAQPIIVEILLKDLAIIVQFNETQFVSSCLQFPLYQNLSAKQLEEKLNNFQEKISQLKSCELFDATLFQLRKNLFYQIIAEFCKELDTTITMGVWGHIKLLAEVSKLDSQEKLKALYDKCLDMYETNGVFILQDIKQKRETFKGELLNFKKTLIPSLKIDQAFIDNIISNAPAAKKLMTSVNECLADSDKNNFYAWYTKALLLENTDPNNIPSIIEALDKSLELSRFAYLPALIKRAGYSLESGESGAFGNISALIKQALSTSDSEINFIKNIKSYIHLQLEILFHPDSDVSQKNSARKAIADLETNKYLDKKNPNLTLSTVKNGLKDIKNLEARVAKQEKKLLPELYSALGEEVTNKFSANLKNCLGYPSAIYAPSLLLTSQSSEHQHPTAPQATSPTALQDSSIPSSGSAPTLVTAAVDINDELASLRTNNAHLTKKVEGLEERIRVLEAANARHEVLFSQLFERMNMSINPTDTASSYLLSASPLRIFPAPTPHSAAGSDSPQTSAIPNPQNS
jgi:hypothetical protein